MSFQSARAILVASLALALGSCATSAKRAPLAGLAAPQRASTVVVLLPQHEIEVDKNQVYGGGGLIGALIEVSAESVMDKHRQAAIAPLRDAMLDYDFQSRFLREVETTVLPALAADGAKVTVVHSLDEYQSALQAAPGNALGLQVRYAYEANFRGVYVKLAANFGRFDAKHGARAIEPGQNAVYLSEHGRDVAFGKKAVTDYEVNAPHWGADHAAKTRAALDESIVEAVRIATDDLLQPAVARSAKVEFTGVSTGMAALHRCPMVSEHGERVLLSCDTWGLYAIDRFQMR